MESASGYSKNTALAFHQSHSAVRQAGESPWLEVGSPLELNRAYRHSLEINSDDDNANYRDLQANQQWIREMTVGLPSLPLKRAGWFAPSLHLEDPIIEMHLYLSGNLLYQAPDLWNFRRPCWNNDGLVPIKPARVFFTIEV